MTQSLQDLADSIRFEGALQSSRFQFGDFCLDVRSNSSALLERLEDYFRQYKVGPTGSAKELIAIQNEPPDFGLVFDDWKRDEFLR